jgi:site-specific recombinase XerD
MTGFKKYMAEQRGFSPDTISRYFSYVELFLQWLQKENIKPNQVRHQDIMAYLRHIDNGVRSHQYVQQIMVGVRHYYDYMVMSGKARSNPATGIIKRGSRTKVLRDVITGEQLHAIYQKYPEDTVMWIRNKTITGLLIYQGIHTYELKILTVKDVDLNNAVIHVPGCRRSNARTLKLEACQMRLLKNYIRKFRPVLLKQSRKKTDRLILSAGSSDCIGNLLGDVKRAMRTIEPKLNNLKQVRASAIANWMRKYDPIRVMNMAGHRYVSSTEYYMLEDVESLRDELDRIHPLENIVL